MTVGSWFWKRTKGGLDSLGAKPITVFSCMRVPRGIKGWSLPQKASLGRPQKLNMFTHLTALPPILHIFSCILVARSQTKGGDWRLSVHPSPSWMRQGVLIWSFCARSACVQSSGRGRSVLNPLMHKVAKMVTCNNGVRRHTGLTHGF